MKEIEFSSVVFAAMLTMASASSMAQVMVGGAPMLPTQEIIDNAVNSKDHTTLVAAVKAGGLVETLKGPGPFTVFAPTNAAFAALPPGTVDALLKPESKDKLVKVLTYHVAGGRMDANALTKAIAAGGGKVTVMDVSGGTATVTIADVIQSNGVIHVVDKVLLPK